MLLGFTDFDRDYSPSLKRGEGSTQQLGAGFGVATMVNDRWQAKLDGRFQQKISGGASGTIDLGFNLGMNYFFNPPAPAAAAPAPAPAPVAEVPPETRTITVRLNVEFEFDKAVVRAIYGDELRAVAEAMKTHGDIDLVLEGHTDSIGTDAYNQDLSERRAAAVKERIAQDYGIDRSRIKTVGYGESRPIADNSTEEGRARNRRVIGELSYTEVVGD
jgi:OmpA-OmpF porin, OOP family